MKTWKNLFPAIVAWDNLLLAAGRAQRGKRFKTATARFNLNLEKELLQLERELKSGTYRHGTYCDFIVHDSKKRLISAAPYRDRVVHHALCNIVEPLFDSSFIDDSYACRRGKGTHAAVDRYTAFARKNRFVLKCDIRKYFQSIDHEILMGIIGRRVRCRRTLELIREIICSRNDRTVLEYFPGDDLFTPALRQRAIPIGNLTSQFFANVYLDGFDHYVKETMRCQYYIRYVDDFVVFDNDKDRLWDFKGRMQDFLNGLRLKLHRNKCRIFRVADGVRFLGYRIFPDHRLLPKNNVLRMRRRLKSMQQEYTNWEITLEEVHQRIHSWLGHACHADTYRLRERLLGSVAFSRGAAPENAAGRLVEQQS